MMGGWLSFRACLFSGGFCVLCSSASRFPPTVQHSQRVGASEAVMEVVVSVRQRKLGWCACFRSWRRDDLVLNSIDSVVDSNGANGYPHALDRAHIRGDFQDDFQDDLLDDYRDGSRNNSLDGFLGSC